MTEMMELTDKGLKHYKYTLNVQEGREKHTYYEDIHVKYKIQPNGTFID